LAEELLDLADQLGGAGQLFRRCRVCPFALALPPLEPDISSRKEYFRSGISQYDRIYQKFLPPEIYEVLSAFSNLDYDFPLSKTILDPPTTLISILIVAGLIGYSIWTAKKRPMLSFWILWYFGNLVIESSIFPLEIVYEHRLYLPSVGPFVLFSLLVVRGIEHLKSRAIFSKPTTIP
jgi:hypothetical protein